MPSRSTTTRPTLSDWLTIVHHWLYPPTCLLCGQAGHAGLDLCADCGRSLPYIKTACRRCGTPLADGPTVCGACLRRPPGQQATVSVFHYQEPIAWLLQGFKYRRRLSHGRLLGALFAQALCTRRPGPLPQALLAVPLHPQRQRRRGYNQALELARPLSRHLGLPLLTGICRRIRNTPPQTELPARARRSNLRGAFALHRALDYRHLAIIDDVMTTGTTASELACVLRRGGVEVVEVWSLARTG